MPDQPRVWTSARLRALVIFLGLAWFAVGCTRPPVEIIARGPTMGTQYTAKIVVANPETKSAAVNAFPQAVLDSLEVVNSKMSTYTDASELARFNASRSIEPTPMSAETIEVLARAQQVSAESGGAFDVTVAPLVAAWGFGPDKREAASISDEALAALRREVGYQNLTVDQSGGFVSKRLPGIRIDVNAIAPGYATDLVAKAVEDLGFMNYMIEVGGEVRARGHNRFGKPWQIAIERPLDVGREIELIVPLEDRALATSGDYRNYYEQDGKRISHTIDPRTGRPIAHNLASVSVIHRECVMADAYATALMVLGPEEGYEFAVARELPAFFIVRVGENVFEERATPEFDELIAANPTGAVPSAESE